MFSAKQFKAGSTAFVRATPFLFKNGMGWWYVVPVLLYLILFFATFFGFSQWASPYAEEWVASHLDVTMPKEDVEWWRTVLSFLAKSAVFLTGFVIKFLVFLILSQVMKYIILILMSPVLAYLSEKTESILTGADYPFDLKQFLKDVARGIFFALRSLFAEFGIIALVGILSFFISVLLPFTAIFLFFINCFYMGVSLMDYVAERRKLSIGESMSFMRKNKGTLIGIGLMFNLIYRIPFLGIVVAPINGAVGCVLAQNEIESKL